MRRHNLLAEVGLLLFLERVLRGHRLERCGQDGELQRVMCGEQVEHVERAAEVEELESWEKDYADVFGRRLLVCHGICTIWFRKRGRRSYWLFVMLGV